MNTMRKSILEEIEKRINLSNYKTDISNRSIKKLLQYELESGCTSAPFTGHWSIKEDGWKSINGWIFNTIIINVIRYIVPTYHKIGEMPIGAHLVPNPLGIKVNIIGYDLRVVYSNGLVYLPSSLDEESVETLVKMEKRENDYARFWIQQVAV